MRAAVTYYTKTGHSKRIAEGIGTELKIPVSNITMGLPATEGEPIDILFLVGGIYAGKSAPEMVEAVAKISPDSIKKVVLLTSSLNPQAEQHSIRGALTDRGINVEEEAFKCTGGFLIFARKRPNEQDVQNAVDFARSQLER